MANGERDRRGVEDENKKCSCTVTGNLKLFLCQLLIIQCTVPIHLSRCRATLEPFDVLDHLNCPTCNCFCILLYVSDFELFNVM